MYTDKQKAKFRRWVFTEVKKERVDKDIASAMISEECFENGVLNYLDTYQFFTPEQKTFIMDFDK